MEKAKNYFKKLIRTFDDVFCLSSHTGVSVQIMRDSMEFDGVHDEHHLLRVVRNALWFAEGKANLDILIPAAILHDVVNVPKDSPDRSKASTFSAELAKEKLVQYSPTMTTDIADGIYHAIQAHSWSANIDPLTWEAKVLQDADRIEALGYLGMARLFTGGGKMNRPLLCHDDPMAKNRELDETKYSLDHYFVKSTKIAENMKTPLGKVEADRLSRRMHRVVMGIIDEL